MKFCEQCGEDEAVPTERFCEGCRKQKLPEMREAGYLRPTPRIRATQYRDQDACEDVRETKFGADRFLKD